MVELISTLVIIGVLMAVAIPRILAPSPFKVRALADEIAAEIRYAQQLNMNYDANATFRIENRRMFIVRDGGNIHLRSRQNDGNDDTEPYRRLPSEITLDRPSYNLTFSRLGQPYIPGESMEVFADENIKVTYGGENTILCIEPETGFVDVRHGSGSCP
jgi:type II secretory pathway pseudopilin PulG